MSSLDKWIAFPVSRITGESATDVKYIPVRNITCYAAVGKDDEVIFLSLKHGDENLNVPSADRRAVLDFFEKHKLTIEEITQEGRSWQEEQEIEKAKSLDSQEEERARGNMNIEAGKGYPSIEAANKRADAATAEVARLRKVIAIVLEDIGATPRVHEETLDGYRATALHIQKVAPGILYECRQALASQV